MSKYLTYIKFLLFHKIQYFGEQNHASCSRKVCVKSEFSVYLTFHSESAEYVSFIKVFSIFKTYRTDEEGVKPAVNVWPPHDFLPRF